MAHKILIPKTMTHLGISDAQVNDIFNRAPFDKALTSFIETHKNNDNVKQELKTIELSACEKYIAYCTKISTKHGDVQFCLYCVFGVPFIIHNLICIQRCYFDETKHSEQAFIEKKTKQIFEKHQHLPEPLKISP